VTPTGTSNLATNVPVALATTSIGKVFTLVFPNLIVIFLLATKFEPVMVTSAPAVPFVGETVIVLAITTLNAADAVLPVASVAVMV